MFGKLYEREKITDLCLWQKGGGGDENLRINFLRVS